MRATARARSNIALAKYWGKSDVALNLPAVPSLSMTLDGLVTDTEVRFDPKLRADRISLDGKRASQGEATRIVELLDRVRERADIGALYAHVDSTNNFPTAAGLASSASGFAALAAAATVAAGLRYQPRVVSAMARRSSASAARSVFGGFVELPAGKEGDERLAARQVRPADHWDVRLVVALTTRGKKAVGSTAGMERSRRTSPLYDAWVERAPGLARTVKRGLIRRELSLLGPAMEQSTMAFHACAMSSNPGIMYWRPATLAALATVQRLRDRGLEVYATMDAGPHVKALCHATDAARVRAALRRTAGVIGTISCTAGPGLEVSRG